MGISFAWDEVDGDFDETDRLFIEWGLFNQLTLGTRRTYTTTVKSYVKWSWAHNVKKPFPIPEINLALYANYRV